MNKELHCNVLICEGLTPLYHTLSQQEHQQQAGREQDHQSAEADHGK